MLCTAPCHILRLVGGRSVNMVTVYAHSLRRFSLTRNEWKHPFPVTQIRQSQSVVSNDSFLPKTWAGKRRNERSRSNHRKKWRPFSNLICTFGPAQNEHPCVPNIRFLAPLGLRSATTTSFSRPQVDVVVSDKVLKNGCLVAHRARIEKTHFDGRSLLACDSC